MTDDNARESPSRIPYLFGCLLLGTSLNGYAEEIKAVGNEPSQQTLTARQAMKAMSGMAGVYRLDQTGDTYLYPLIKIKQDLNGMHGTYRVTPQGIILQPTGMEASDVSMSEMGGITGSFRVTPDGDAYFQPKPHSPIGMSGDTGKERHRGTNAP
jgi:hypothetical protein